MKKILTIIGATIFALSFGIAYAGSGLYNGVTDFSGKSLDTFELAPATAVAGGMYESSAPGSKRLVEDFNNTGKSYDTFELGKQGRAERGPRQNWAGKESRVRAYDTFEIK